MRQVLVIDYDKNDYRIEFLGEKWIVIDRAITTPELFKEWCRNPFSIDSFAHIMPDDRILRYGIQIGTVDDIIVLEEYNLENIV